MKKINYFLVLALLFGVVGLAAAQDNVESSENTEGEVFCTQDVRQCSDGSFVSRTGPNCEFKTCPLDRMIKQPEIRVEPKTSNPNQNLRLEKINKDANVQIKERENSKNPPLRAEEQKSSNVFNKFLDSFNTTNPNKPPVDWQKREEEMKAERIKKEAELKQEAIGGVRIGQDESVEVSETSGTVSGSDRPSQEKRTFFNILKGNPDKFREEAEKRLEALPAEAQARIESIKQEFEAKREEAKTSFETKREALKEKLSIIKDEKKQEVVSRLNENINELNKKKTEEFSKVVAKLEGIWASIQKRASQVAQNGVEVGFISDTQIQINSLFSAAKDSLNQQAGKSYELNITTENNLKTDIGQVRQTLESDLKAVREKMGAIKELLYKTAIQLNQVSAPSVETAQ
ncbi:MAG: hypothetical protein Q8L36_00760 [bacterium]|nr:hypothetical protein [bacterium]